MRRWIIAFAGLVLSACAPNYAGPMTGSSGYVVNTSPYAYGGASPYSSPYGFNSGFGGSNRFSPKKGLTCDRDRHICYDRYGVDYFQTNKYLGSKSAKRGAKRYGEQVFIFAPQQGVVCDRRSQSCSDGNGLNATLTRKYFSKDDTRRVGVWTNADLFSPQAGVACNRTAQICSVNGVPNVDLTQLYLGRQAALDLANQQNQPTSPSAPATAVVPDFGPPVSNDQVFVPAPVAAPEGDVEPPAAAQSPVEILAPSPTPSPVPAGIDVPTEIPLPAEPEPVVMSSPEPTPEPTPAIAPEPAPMPEPVPMPQPAAPEPAPAAACEGEGCP